MVAILVLHPVKFHTPYAFWREEMGYVKSLSYHHYEWEVKNLRHRQNPVVAVVAPRPHPVQRGIRAVTGAVRPRQQFLPARACKRRFECRVAGLFLVFRDVWRPTTCVMLPTLDRSPRVRGKGVYPAASLPAAEFVSLWSKIMENIGELSRLIITAIIFCFPPSRS